jgi:uncharacterized membrane protein
MRSYQTGGEATMGSDMLAKGLGLISLGLGVAGLMRPEATARFGGVNDGAFERGLLRAVGVREITQGLGILTQPQPTGWVWSRVVGDAMDLSFVGFELLSGRARRRRAAVALASLVGITAVDLLCATALSRRVSAATSGGGTTRERGVQVVTVARSPEEVYRYRRDFENFPRFMRYVEAVRVDGNRSHWRAAAPWGGSVEWDAELTEEQPNELIAWRSLPGSEVEHEGRVRFRAAPSGRGTEVEVWLRYEPPAGALGQAAAKLVGREPRRLVYDDLRRFKQVVETGEVIVSDATVDGSGMPQRPAQPPEDAAQTAGTLVGAGR